MFVLILQFMVELTRALLVDALSGRIGSQVGELWRVRRIKRSGAAIRHIHRLNRERLLNRLLTEIQDQL
jgi:hypothetical protein